MSFSAPRIAPARTTFAFLALVLISQHAANAQGRLLVPSSDTPLSVPDGGAGTARSTIDVAVDGTVTSVVLYAEIDFSGAPSGALLYLEGPNTLPPSGLNYLGCAAGGSIYAWFDDEATVACSDLDCCSSGCGTVESPVTCAPFNSLTEFFAGEPSDGGWHFEVGQGPNTAGTTIERWILELVIQDMIFADSFEFGSTEAWDSNSSN